MNSPLALSSALLSSFLLAGTALADDVYRCVPAGGDEPVFIPRSDMIEMNQRGDFADVMKCAGWVEHGGNCPGKAETIHCAKFEKTDTDSFEYLAKNEQAPPMLRDAAQQLQNAVAKAKAASAKLTTASDRLEVVDGDNDTGLRNAVEGMDELSGLAGYAAETDPGKRSDLLEKFHHGADSVKIAALLLANNEKHLKETVYPPLDDADKDLHEAMRLRDVGLTDLDAFQGDQKGKNVPGLGADGRKAMEDAVNEAIDSARKQNYNVSNQSHFQETLIYGTLLPRLKSLRDSLEGPAGLSASAAPSPDDARRAWTELKPKIAFARSEIPSADDDDIK